MIRQNEPMAYHEAKINITNQKYMSIGCELIWKALQGETDIATKCVMFDKDWQLSLQLISSDVLHQSMCCCFLITVVIDGD